MECVTPLDQGPPTVGFRLNPSLHEAGTYYYNRHIQKLHHDIWHHPITDCGNVGLRLLWSIYTNAAQRSSWQDGYRDSKHPSSYSANN